MHVLYFHQHFSTPSGSTGTRSYENCKKLLENGHTVTMVCGSYRTGRTGLDGPFVNGKRRGTVAGIDVIELELDYANQQSLLKRTMVFLRFAARSVRVALAEPCDIAFATSTPLTAALPGIFARIFRRKPFVFEVRDLWPELPKAMGVITNPVILWMLRMLEMLAYRTATSCVGLSPGIVKGIEDSSPRGKRVALIPNGCDLELFARVAGKRDTGVNAEKPRMIAAFTGAHGLANGLHAVLHAAEALRQRGRDDIQIVLVGDGLLKQELRERAIEQKLDNVRFLDPMPKTELDAYMAEVDVGLMLLANVPAFYYGTSPNKFFDYISMGLPVLNNYPGWLAEMIQKEDIGIAVPPDDPEAFADALIQFADQPDERVARGVRAREFAAREFDRSRLTARFVRELEWAAGQ